MCTECSKFFGMHKNRFDNTYVLDITIEVTLTYSTATSASTYVTAASAALTRQHQQSRSNTYTNVTQSFTVSENFRCCQLLEPNIQTSNSPSSASLGWGCRGNMTHETQFCHRTGSAQWKYTQYTWPIATGVPVWNTSVTHGTFIYNTGGRLLYRHSRPDSRDTWDATLQVRIKVQKQNLDNHRLQWRTLPLWESRLIRKNT